MDRDYVNYLATVPARHYAIRKLGSCRANKVESKRKRHDHDATAVPGRVHYSKKIHQARSGVDRDAKMSQFGKGFVPLKTQIERPKRIIVARPRRPAPPQKTSEELAAIALGVYQRRRLRTRVASAFYDSALEKKLVTKYFANWNGLSETEANTKHWHACIKGDDNSTSSSSSFSPSDINTFPSVSVDHADDLFRKAIPLPTVSQPSAPFNPYAAVKQSSEMKAKSDLEAVEIDRIAKKEALTCVSTEGLLKLNTLADAISGKTDRFRKLVLSHLPYSLVSKLLEQKNAIMKTYPRLRCLSNALSHEVVAESLSRAEFDGCRQMIRTAPPQSPSLPHTAAFKVFGSNGALDPRFVRQRVSGDMLTHPVIVPADPHLASPFSAYFDNPAVGTPSLVTSASRFRLNFDAFTKHQLRGIDFDGIVVAGGAVIASLLPLPSLFDELYNNVELATQQWAPVYAKLGKDAASVVQKFWDPIGDAKAALQERLSRWYLGANGFGHSDIDMFLCVKSEEEAADKVQKIYDQLVKNLPAGTPHRLLRSAHAITFCSEYPYRHVQIVTCMVRSVDEILHFADMDCTAFGFDGRDVWAVPRSVRSVNLRCNFVAPKILKRECTPRRIMKYARRGFGSILFEICKHTPRCDVAINGVTQDILCDIQTVVSAPNVSIKYEELQLPFHSNFSADRLEEELANLEARGIKNWILGKSLDEVMAVDMVSGALSENDLDLSDLSEMTPEHVLAIQHFKHGIRPIRWKRDDMLSSRHADMFLPFCYQCGNRFVPSTCTDTTTNGSAPAGSDSQSGTEQLASALSSDMLCPDCSVINLKKRLGWVSGVGDDAIWVPADKHYRVALVTGARIKIGYHCTLGLLRAGFVVIALTRFPHEAAARYREERDSFQWRERLHIYGIDLRNIPSVISLLQHIRSQYTRMDVIINNAAQTIRRPPAYYRSLFERETELQQSNLPWLKAMVKSVGKDPWATSNEVKPSFALLTGNNSNNRASSLSSNEPRRIAATQYEEDDDDKNIEVIDASSDLASPSVTPRAHSTPAPAKSHSFKPSQLSIPLRSSAPHHSNSTSKSINTSVSNSFDVLGVDEEAEDISISPSPKEPAGPVGVVKIDDVKVDTAESLPSSRSMEEKSSPRADSDSSWEKLSASSSPSPRRDREPSAPVASSFPTAIKTTSRDDLSSSPVLVAAASDPSSPSPSRPVATNTLPPRPPTAVFFPNPSSSPSSLLPRPSAPTNQVAMPSVPSSISNALSNVRVSPSDVIALGASSPLLALSLVGGMGGSSLSPAQLTQVPMLPGDQLTAAESTALFPANMTDSHGEPLDLRPATTWNTGIEEVSILEMLEVQLVNSTVPFLIVSELLKMMKTSDDDTSAAETKEREEKIPPGTKSKAAKRTPPAKRRDYKFIVNVSSAEGQFSTRAMDGSYSDDNNKQSVHPHTNMAKAALNMMTRSIASSLARQNIFVTAVDTGWVSRLRAGMSRYASATPPLSEEDGAARVLDPIFSGYLGPNIASPAPAPSASPSSSAAAGLNESSSSNSSASESSTKVPKAELPLEVAPHYGVLLQNFERVPW